MSWIFHTYDTIQIPDAVILRSLTARNDLDSDIASLADWLRLGAHGTHWQPRRTDQGGLNLNPRCQHGGFGWHHGRRGGRGRLSSGRPTPARRWCAILHISYDTRFEHHRWWYSGQSSLAVCMRSMVRIQALNIFCKMFYTRIYAYTNLYPDTQCLYAYILSCISIHVVTLWSCISVQIYRVILACMLIYSVYTSIYWFVLSTKGCCLLSGSQFSERF